MAMASPCDGAASRRPVSQESAADGAEAESSAIDKEAISTPLLPSPSLADGDGREPSDTYREHLRAVCRLASPIILSEIFQSSLQLISVGFVGQLGKDALAAAALATAWFNVWDCTMNGFMTAVDTLLSQAHGAGEREQFGILTGISLLLVFFATVVLSGLVGLCGTVMHWVGQDPKVATMAGEFSYRLIPGLFPLYLFKVLLKYLQTQHILSQGIYIGIFAVLCTVLLNWALIIKAKWGLAGSSWAITITRAMEFIVIVIYILIKKDVLAETKPRFPKENWCVYTTHFMSLGASGAAAMSAGAWFFELTTILAGLLGTVEVSAHIITMSIDSLLYFGFMSSTGLAASIQIGKLMGDQRPGDARRSTRVFFAFSSALQLVLIIILLAFRVELGNLFSSDDEVSLLVSQLIPILCVFMAGDAIDAVNNGVLRGLGRQAFALILNIVGFWVVGTSVGSALVFGGKLGIYGIWWGLVAGVYSAAAIGSGVLYRVDWSKESVRVLSRLSSFSTTDSTRLSLEP